MSTPTSLNLKRTPLFERHRALGGKLVEFGGWEMPVQYAGLTEEHNAVRAQAGLFDVSHMGEIRVKGPRAFELVQKLTCNDVAALDDGKVQYSAFLTEAGTFVDDLLTYRLAEDDYLLVVNAGNTPKDVAWAKAHEIDGAAVTDESSDWAQIAIQGPKAEQILQTLTDVPLASITYYRFRWASVRGKSGVAGAKAIVSRTGYTGEDGFEIYLPSSDAADVWDALIDAGRPHGLVPAGLGARDTLRLEAKLALYGNDIDDTVTPLEADLSWIVKMKKGDFIGRPALEKQKADGLKKKLVGFEMNGRGIGRHGYPLMVNETGEPGIVTSGTQTPTIGKAIGLAYTPIGAQTPGTTLTIDIRGKGVAAAVVPTPFYKRSSS
ncbi:MAG: glycine cleavage system aminomethyltransferase GcvT [Thermoanaerobaculia bacterium]